MPKPEEGETEKEFLKRCIPYLIKDENYGQKQSVAICYSIYRKDGSKIATCQKAIATQQGSYHVVAYHEKEIKKLNFLLKFSNKVIY